MSTTITQSNAGGFNGTTGNATLPSGTTAGNWLLLIIGHGSSSTNLTPAPPTGFTSATGSIGDQANNSLGLPKTLYYRKETVAGETSWTIAQAASGQVCWCVIEVEGLDLLAPKDVTPATISFSTGTSISTGTTPMSTTYDGLVIAAHTAFNATNATIPTWSGHTNGLVELAEAGVAGASTAAALSVSLLPVQQLGTFSCTATSSVTANLSSSIVVYSAAGAKRAANVVNMAGFEWGSVAGLATGVALNNPLFDSFGGSPAIVANPRPGSGAYALELSSSAAAEYVQWAGSASTGATSNVMVMRFSIMFPTALPGADVDLASMSGASGTTLANQGMTLRYRTASQKLGIQVRDVGAAVNGTEQLSTNAVVANTWYNIDILYAAPGATSRPAGTPYTVDWQIDAVAQTQASVTVGGSVGQGASAVSFGWLSSSTATVRYDDVVLSRTVGHYPLGDFRILPLKPDPAGTLTISGTTANFNTFSNNGTMAAWNAATALAAIDELPPTIGATADGIAQVNLAASDYVEIPMETYNAVAAGRAVRGVKMYACGWAASTTAATIGFRGYEGTAETVLYAVADPEFDNSTTTPAWLGKMFKPTDGWTQTKLDALAFRMGFSGDATPDIGIHSIMAEVAVRQGETRTVFGDFASAAVDPDSQGVITLSATAPTDYPATLRYEVAGSPTDVSVAGGTTESRTLEAPDAPTVNRVTLYCANEPDPPA